MMPIRMRVGLRLLMAACGLGLLLAGGRSSQHVVGGLLLLLGLVLAAGDYRHGRRLRRGQ
jgi:hypothetical protein